MWIKRTKKCRRHAGTTLLPDLDPAVIRTRRQRLRRTSAGLAEQPEIDDAVVGGQEVQKPLVVTRVDAEQRQQRPIVAARIRETEVVPSSRRSFRVMSRETKSG